MPQAYENAGVSVEAGYEVVKRIKSHVARTNRPGVVGGIGGFGGLFDLASLGYKEPVLISGTDGVGTKLVVAKMVDKHDTIGVDCVAMWSTTSPPKAPSRCSSSTTSPAARTIRRCSNRSSPAWPTIVQSDAGLIGGETAEMPGMYDEDEYDLAGFAVGVARKSAIVDGSGITAGDVLIGLPSTGVHSNGFSLVRKALFEQAGCARRHHAPRTRRSQARRRAAHARTRIYVKTLKPLFKAGVVKGVAHITGGGFIENIPRMIPDGLAADITLDPRPSFPSSTSWNAPATSTTRRCTTSSTWASAWCSPSPPNAPTRRSPCSRTTAKPEYAIGTPYVPDTDGTQITLK